MQKGRHEGKGKKNYANFHDISVRRAETFAKRLLRSSGNVVWVCGFRLAPSVRFFSFSLQTLKISHGRRRIAGLLLATCRTRCCNLTPNVDEILPTFATDLAFTGLTNETSRQTLYTGCIKI